MEYIIRKQHLDLDDKKKYISKQEFCETLEIKNDSKICCDVSFMWKIRRILIRNSQLYYNIQDVNRAIEETTLFYNEHYTREDTLNRVSKHVMKKLTPVRVPSKYSKIFKKSMNFSRFVYKKKEVNAIIPTEHNFKHKKIIFDNLEYIDAVTFRNKLEIGSKPIDTLNIINEWGVRTVTKEDDEVYYCLVDVMCAIRETKEFFSKHYTKKQLNKYLKFYEYQDIKNIKIPYKYKILLKNTINKSENVSVIKKEDIKERYEQKKYLQEGLNKGTVINMKKAMDILNVGVDTFHKIVENGFLSNIKYDEQLRMNLNWNLYKVEDVNKILKLQKEFYKIYIDLKHVSIKYNHNLKIKNAKLTIFNAPIYTLTKDRVASISAIKGVLSIEEVEKFIHRMEFDKLDGDFVGITNFETFEYRLYSSLKWNGFDRESVYTEKNWMEYIKNLLNNTVSGGSVLSSRINLFIRTTFDLINLLEKNMKKEIYSLTSSEINLAFRYIGKSRKLVLYDFLKLINTDIISCKRENNRCFKIAEVTHPKSKDNNENSIKKDVPETYDFDEYAQVYNYCIDVNLHVKNAIKEIQKDSTAKYLSTWLYVMLHLNNAWRSGDVNNFPKIDIYDILNENNINDVEWFIGNTINLPIARKIISRILQWEFIISKTQIKGAFFCSDILAPALATAISLLSLVHKKIVFSEQINLMIFGTKHNGINTQHINKFFSQLRINNFKFGSRKFNKSVMTYIYYIANLSGGEKGLIYAQKLRAHISESSTLHYINVNLEELDNISEQLFARGEFGFIPSLLIQKINGKNLSFDDITREVSRLNSTFGSLVKINSTLGFLNKIRKEREKVINLISQSSLNECQSYLINIFTNNMPSKCGSEIQCLSSLEGCLRNDLISCFECPYHIPTIYAISLLYDNIIADIENYHSSNNIPFKIKLALGIEKKKLVLLEAIKKFGKEYVYSCLDIEREEFIMTMASISNWKNLRRIT
ncbi:hypothetical protein [Clostridium sp. YIM B02500]|uniref:hypothetical protein n=1 Tax=Clostridium sp. YIM B02500 TaxID=2910681 RepID=UPI001EEE1F7D|nr:hypothetical protein [Clostridium sp. YIM B02500]